jgi:hypothetical protein
MVLLTVFLGSLTSTHAEGLVQSASKEAVKGVVKGIVQQLNPGEIEVKTKEATKGAAEGLGDVTPMITSQILNQANVNRKAIGSIARQATTEAFSGALDATVREVNQTLGPKANGPLAEAMAATTERTVAAATRGLLSEVNLDPAATEKISAAVVRGAVSELHFQFPIWSFLIAFVLGGFSTLLCACGLLALYLLFTHKHSSEMEPSGIQAGAGRHKLACA